MPSAPRSTANLQALVDAAGLGERPTEAVSTIDGALAGLAFEEGLAPLLGARLGRGELAAADPAAAEVLRRAHRESVAREMLREAETAPLLGELAARCVPALALKGTALAALVYPDPGSRSMGDVDLLVPAERWQEALAAAADLGLEASWSKARPLTARRFHEVHLQLAHTVVDLHRALHDPRLFTVDHPALFARARPAAGGLLLPDPTDLLLSLATHVAQDGFYGRQRAIVDSLALVAGGEVEPEALVERAHRWRAASVAATWLRALLRFGLAAEPWSRTAAELDPRGRTRRLAAELPRLAPPPGWRLQAAQKWHLSRALGPDRAAAFFLGRAGLFALDAAHALLPRRRRDAAARL